MIQCGGGSRLAREALACVRHIEIAGENLDGDHAPQNGIVGNVDSAHPTAAEPSLNFITTKLSAGLEHRMLQGYRTGVAHAPQGTG
jgi:hypothetical protein